jgi:Uma2 family endonuclease
MNILAHPEKPAEAMPAWRAVPEQRLLLHDVGWESYLAIGNALCDRPALRMTYDRGSLEFMVTSSQHEIYKRLFSRLIEALTEECQKPIVTAGNMTFQREDLERGLEADDCFWIAQEPRMRGKLTWDPEMDPPPDLALEIEISRSALPRMTIYAALGVPEVWRFDGTHLRVELLQTDRTYAVAESSLCFPAIPVSEIVPFLQPSAELDSLSVLRSFRVWVRLHLEQKQG